MKIHDIRANNGARLRLGMSHELVNGKTYDEVLANLKLLAGDLVNPVFYISEMGDQIEFQQPPDSDAASTDQDTQIIQ